jgi:hypothetical protein
MNLGKFRGGLRYKIEDYLGEGQQPSVVLG